MDKVLTYPASVDKKTVRLGYAIRWIERVLDSYDEALNWLKGNSRGYSYFAVQYRQGGRRAAKQNGADKEGLFWAVYCEVRGC